MTDESTDPRLAAARRLLMEAVYASRSGKAGAVLAGSTSDDAGNCGLGVGPNLDVGVLGAGAADEARDAAATLWPDGLDAARTESARATVRAWVKRQDGLDRKRNHFIKDFRGEHGFDRTAYSDAVLAAYETGVEAVNRENRDGLDAAARALCEL